jgi:acetyltransferase-like isoleucine patch superfamily enzyme
VIIDDYAVLDGKGDREVTIDIGAGSIIGRNSILSCKQVAETSGHIVLKEQVNVSVNCTLISESELLIGEKVLIAGHCYLNAGGNHGLDRIDVAILEQPMVHKGGIRIGPGSWLGASCVLLDGATIGERAVIAAGAVVNGHVQDCTIVGGMPARLLRDRSAEADKAATTR